MRAKTAALIVALVIEIILLVVIGVIALLVNTLLGVGLGSVFFLGPMSLAFWLILLIIGLLLVILIIGTAIALVASAVGDRRRRKEKHKEVAPVSERVVFWHEDVDKSKAIDVVPETVKEVRVTGNKEEAIRILDQRFARGEITRDDYMKMKEDIIGK